MTYPRLTWTRDLRLESDTHLYINMSHSVGPSDWMPDVILEVERLQKLSSELDAVLILRLTAFSNELSGDAVPIAITPSYPSVEQLQSLVRAMPWALGGTDFGLVWDRINSDFGRNNRDNAIITDLEWDATPAQFLNDHPVNLRYIAVGRTTDLARAGFASRLDDAGIFSADFISP